MTRFEREISGSLGAFWKKNAEEEVRKAVAQADTQATVEADGAMQAPLTRAALRQAETAPEPTAAMQAQRRLPVQGEEML